jgi:bifunctional DNA-binding transcriptional regulator/antitoxin component of YhaV-PrlF toxin-antitoxin module
MQKKLSTLGNSVALVIDKPIRRLLGIGPETLVDVSTDGRRIVIEPLRPAERDKRSPNLGMALDAPRVLRMLKRDYSIDPDRFARLYHGPSQTTDKVPLSGIRAMLRYQSFLELTDRQHAQGQELADMHRMQDCLQALQSGRSWDDAIEEALRAHPKPAG